MLYPTATICGGVHVGEGSQACLSSTVRERIVIADWCTLGMGAVPRDRPGLASWQGQLARGSQCFLPATFRTCSLLFRGVTFPHISVLTLRAPSHVNAFVSQVVSCAHSPAQAGDGPAMLRVAHARQLRQRSTTAALLSKPTDHPFSTMVLYACAMCVRHQLDSGPTVCGVHVQCV